MSEAQLRVIAEEYASHGLSTIVLSPQSKSPLVKWKSYQYEPPSAVELDAMFSFEDKLNIGVVCGAASKNLAVIHAETTLAFETQLRRCEQAGVADTWIEETSRGGHILTRLPTAVKPKSFKGEGFEVRGQGQYVLVPPFSRTGWIFEPKWDGYRALCFLCDGVMRFTSRNQRDLTKRFPELQIIANSIKASSAILDGEIVALNEYGSQCFDQLQNHKRDCFIIYFAFDLLFLNGESLTEVPLIERKAQLKRILPKGMAGRLRYTDHVIDRGLDLFAALEAFLSLEDAIINSGCWTGQLPQNYEIR